MNEAGRRQAPRPGRHLPVGAPVLWTGIALGTFLAVTAIKHGVMLRLFGGFADAILTFVLLIAAGVVLTELTRRHHRAAGRLAVRHGKRGASAAYRGARRHGGRGAVFVAAQARARWESREHRPLMFRRLRGEPESPAAEAEGSEGSRTDGRTYSWGPEASPSGWPTDDLARATEWAQISSSDGKPYVVTEYPPGGGPGRTIATYVGGKPAPDHANADGGTSEMPASPSRIKTEHRARRAAARSGGTVPSEWGPVIAETADFEPEDDGELLEWMSRQVTGLSAWAEALVDFYEHATNTIGIDPKASAMLHDVADAAAQAAETMGAAKAKFTEHYELPREFAGNGGLMTHDGRWITGEGA